MTTPDPYSDPVTTDPGDGLAVSDAAAAVLYPDVDSGPPPQVTPQMLTVPAPFAERESPLLDVVRAYGTGEADWPTTKQALIDFDYQPREQLDSEPLGSTAGAWYGDVENRALAPSDPGTWDELQEATDAGMLTRAEFGEVLAARASKGQPADTGGDTSQGGDTPPPQT